jgi:hypothetical protein
MDEHFDFGLQKETNNPYSFLVKYAYRKPNPLKSVYSYHSTSYLTADGNVHSQHRLRELLNF